MSNESKITTDLEVDDALVQDANYVFDADDRQYIDNQILGVEQHLVDALIKGRHASYFSVDGASAALAVGDVICTASSTLGTVTKVTSTKIAQAKAALAVVLKAASPGGKVLAALGGVLPPSITGLAVGSAAYVKVNTATARLERTTAPTDSDYVLGTVDLSGYMRVAPGSVSGGGSSLATANGEAPQQIAQVETEDATPTSIGDAFDIPADSLVTVDAQIEAIKDDASVAKIFNLRRSFLNATGTVTDGTQVDLITPEVIGGALAASASITRTGTTGRYEVVGVAATNLRWILVGQQVRITAAGGVAGGGGGGGGTFDPLTIASMTSWNKGSYTGAPWVGSFGGEDLVSVGIDPTVGTALDGKTPASYAAPPQYVTSESDASVLIPGTAYSIVAMIKGNNAAAPAGGAYDDPGITSDGFGFNFGFNSSGVRIGHYDTINGVWVETPNVACPEDEWHVVSVRYDGTNIYVGVDGVEAAGVPAGERGINAGSKLALGFSAVSAGAAYQGDIMERMTFGADIGTTALANLISYFQATYPSAGI